MTNIFIYLLIAHFLSDYYLQTESLAKEKRTKYKALIKHSLIYGLSSLVFLVAIYSYDLIIYFVLFALSHFLIDTIKFYICNKHLAFAKKNEVPIYFLDQAIHVLTIFLIAYFIGASGSKLEPIYLLKAVDFKTNHILKSALALLLIFKPVNITFKITYSHIKESIPSDGISSSGEASSSESDNEVRHDEDESDTSNSSLEINPDLISEREEEKELNVGKLIGNLERLLLLMLLSVGEYSAIGLIFAAKSITRYNQISSNKRFAEYYLLGTLYSILATLIIYQSIFVWF